MSKNLFDFCFLRDFAIISFWGTSEELRGGRFVLEFEGISITWLGHDSMKIKGDGKVIYIDPWKLKDAEPADNSTCNARAL